MRKMKLLSTWLAAGAVLGVSLVALTSPAQAQGGEACAFETDGQTMTLQGDCVTTASILVPDGFTLDGAGHTIKAADPEGDHFRGGVIVAEEGEAHVRHVTLTTDGLREACGGQGERLIGVSFKNAFGSITRVQVVGLRRQGRNCQEANGIHVSNAPFANYDCDPTTENCNPDTKDIRIADNVVVGQGKNGITVAGDFNATVEHNNIGASSAATDITTNGIQVSFGSTGVVRDNFVHGNQNEIDGGADGTNGIGILLYTAPNTSVEGNTVVGNANIGIDISAGSTGARVRGNRIFDRGMDFSPLESIADVGINVTDTSMDGTVVEDNNVQGYRLAEDLG